MITAVEASKRNLEVFNMAPVVPILVVEDIAKAFNLGTALVAGGLPVLEVTLRTAGALDAISSMARIKGGVVGAGTLLTPKDVKDAKAAGAQFGVSPGATDILISACESVGLPLLVGAATASESMKLLEKGYSVQKFFPAEASGGAKALSSFASPLPQIKFCPTGGILPKNATDYLMLQNVICVGGSWVAPKDLVTAGKWDAIEALAKIASEL